jgi:hypothetical protein
VQLERGQKSSQKTTEKGEKANDLGIDSFQLLILRMARS